MDASKIGELYKKIPESKCDNQCTRCCTNIIQFTPSEKASMGGYEYNGKCSHLIDGKCSIYENRPFVCRIFGTSEILRCDNCIPERFLSEKETEELVHQYVLIKKKRKQHIMTVIRDILQSLCRQEFFNQLTPVLDTLSINYSIIKGEALSIQAYGSTGNRNFTDIDILVARKNLNIIEQRLMNNGFFNVSQSRSDKITMMTGSHQIAPWIKEIYPWGQVVVDLNFDIFWGEYEGNRIDIDEFVSDAIERNIYGTKVKTLAILKAMVQLILHHYKDMNSIFLLATRKSIKYEMFKDVYYLLKNNLGIISIDSLYDISLKYDIVPYVYYILYYTGQVFNDEMLNRYIDAFRTPTGEGLLNCYGLCAKEQKEWKYNFQTRIEADSIYDLIKDDLTEKDKEKIDINRRIFLGDYNGSN